MRWRDRLFAKGKLASGLGATESFLTLVVLVAAIITPVLLLVALAFLIVNHGW